MNYYKMVMDDEDSWCLALQDYFPDGTAVDEWAYSMCNFIHKPKKVPLEIYQEGPPVDFNLEAFGAYICSRRMLDLIEQLDPKAIQRIPVELDAPGEWEIMNIISCVDCMDIDNCIGLERNPPDHEFKPNEFNVPLRLAIHNDAVGDHHIFRVKQMEVYALVSETLAELLTDNGITGIEFWKVYSAQTIES